MVIILSIAAIWIACWIGAAGRYYAYFQDTYPRFAEEQRSMDAGKAWAFGALGPGALLVSLVCGDKGWRWPGSEP